MIVEFKNQELVFDWDQLPDKLKTNLELRDKIFQELQQKFKIEEVKINPHSLFEINKYVIDRIKSQIKNNVNN